MVKSLGGGVKGRSTPPCANGKNSMTHPLTNNQNECLHTSVFPPVVGFAKGNAPETVIAKVYGRSRHGRNTLSSSALAEAAGTE